MFAQWSAIQLLKNNDFMKFVGKWMSRKYHPE